MPRSVSDNSRFVEKTIEHLFLAKLSQVIWFREEWPLPEIATAEVDNRGYDVVVSVGTITRHVQLKAQQCGTARREADINIGLAAKPSGCVVWIEYDKETLEFSRLLYFGSLPGIQYQI